MSQIYPMMESTSFPCSALGLYFTLLSSIWTFFRNWILSRSRGGPGGKTRTRTRPGRDKSERSDLASHTATIFVFLYLSVVYQLYRERSSFSLFSRAALIHQSNTCDIFSNQPMSAWALISRNSKFTCRSEMEPKVAASKLDLLAALGRDTLFIVCLFKPSALATSSRIDQPRDDQSHMLGLLKTAPTPNPFLQQGMISTTPTKQRIESLPNSTHSKRVITRMSSRIEGSAMPPGESLTSFSSQPMPCPWCTTAKGPKAQQQRPKALDPLRLVTACHMTRTSLKSRPPRPLHNRSRIDRLLKPSQQTPGPVSASNSSHTVKHVFHLPLRRRAQPKNPSLLAPYFPWCTEDC